VHPHSFLGIDQEGITSIIRTTGNPAGHVVLRGGRDDPITMRRAFGRLEIRLAQAGLPEVLMVDCSHANSGKQHAVQEEVWRSVIQQRTAGTRSLIGIMLESYLVEGNQPFPKHAGEARYGVSVTDPCLGWEATERMLRWGHEELGRCVIFTQNA